MSERAIPPLDPTRRRLLGGGLLATAWSLLADPVAAGTGQPAAPAVPAQPAVDGKVIPIWPEGVPGRKADGGAELVAEGRVSNVHDPTITWFPAPATIATGTGMVVCPGGGYVRLAMANEGSGFTRFLNAIGVSAFVLKYRMVEYGHPAPLRDVLRAIRLVRSRAGEFGVRPDRVGVGGSSAGGHLAACAATLYDAHEGRTGARLDEVSARPDFAILQYPVITMTGPFGHRGSRRNLIGDVPSDELVAHLSVEEQVTKDTPPCFLVHTLEDASVPIENSLMFFQALRRAGVQAEMHLYEKGPHGFGTREGLGPTSLWPKRCEEWMRSHGWLDQA